jgi:ribonuclease HI
MILQRQIINISRRGFSTFVPPTYLDIYTDGSCIDNGKQYAKGGIGVYFPNNEYHNISEPYMLGIWKNPPTSQRCELVAIHKALTIHMAHFSDMRCRIYTDSDYAIRCLISYGDVWKYNGWKKTNGRPVMNVDVLKPMLNLYKQGNGNISLIFVKSHTNARTICALNNNIADSLAKRGTISEATSETLVKRQVSP